MLLKERSSGMYHLAAYYIARTMATLPLDALYPTSFTILVYSLGGLRPSVRSIQVTRPCTPAGPLPLSCDAEASWPCHGTVSGHQRRLQRRGLALAVSIVHLPLAGNDSDGARFPEHWSSSGRIDPSVRESTDHCNRVGHHLHAARWLLDEADSRLPGLDEVRHCALCATASNPQPLRGARLCSSSCSAWVSRVALLAMLGSISARLR